MKIFNFSPLKDKLEEYNDIIVLSHYSPDYDATGSQLSLYLSLKSTYPSKNIIAGGECGDQRFVEYYKDLSIDDYKDALVIITDAGAGALISDQNYTNGDFIIVIDHHTSRSNFGDLSYIDDSQISACLLIYQIIKDLGLDINGEIGHLLMLGIVADSGRFRYKNTDTHTFKVVSELIDLGVDLQDIYKYTSGQDLSYVRYKGYVMNNFKVFKGQVAYITHTKSMVEESGLSEFQVSRGMVSAMADINGIDAWLSFTESEKGILMELRSKEIPVVSVATSLGGGGHALACGATIKSLDQIDSILKSIVQILNY